MLLFASVLKKVLFNPPDRPNKSLTENIVLLQEMPKMFQIFLQEKTHHHFICLLSNSLISTNKNCKHNFTTKSSSFYSLADFPH